MHADVFPLVSDNPSKYKEVLRQTASAAEERIRSSLNFGDKRISVYALTNLQEIKDMETKLNLPINAPRDWQKIFKTIS